MIRLQIDQILYVILEPGNITSFRMMKPLTFEVSEFKDAKHVSFCFCPDIPRLALEVAKLREEGKLTPPRLGKLLKESQEWRDFDRVAS